MKSTNVRFYHYLATVPFRLLGAAWPTGASKVFERILLTPSRQRTKLRFDLTPAPSAKCIDSPVGPLNTWTWGEGPAVLLIHGWNGAAVHWNQLVGPLVTGGFQVTAFDAPGHGHAPRRKTNVVEWRTALQTVASEVGSLHGIVGHSFGSLATILAVQAGVAVHRVALIAPPADLASLTRSIGHQIGFGDEVSGLFLDGLGERLGVSWGDLQSERVVGSLNVPVLVVHDENDREVSWQDGSVIAAAAVDGRLMTTQGLGHRRVLRDPAVIRELVGFLSNDESG